MIRLAKLEDVEKIIPLWEKTRAVHALLNDYWKTIPNASEKYKEYLSEEVTKENSKEFVAGPSNSSYSSSNGVGKYYGCSVNGNALLRGVYWSAGVEAGLFAMNFNYLPSDSGAHIGFRCVR